MKKLYKKPWQWCCGLQKVGITFLTLFGALQGLDAQVSSYTFAQSSGTFNSIAATGTLVTGSDATTATTNDTSGWSVTLPFTFNFNGTGYTSMYVNSNGGATFGTTTSTTSSVISTATAYAGAVGVMNRDLWGAFVTSGVTTTGSNIITNVVSMKGIEVGKTLSNVNGIPTGATVTAFDEVAGTITMSAPATSGSTAAVVRYGSGKIFTSTIGTSPNRVFIVEWIGYNDYGTTVGLSNHLNFQLRLSESNNTISTVYGPHYNVNATAVTNQIGLRGAAATDYNNRNSATSWSATTAGTSNAATVSRSSTIFPALGQTFTWSPPTCLAPSGIAASSITATTASISWTASSTVPANGYEYYYSTSSTAPTSTTVASGTSSGITASLSSLTPATTYYVWVRSLCSASDISGWSVSGTFVTNCNPVATMSENFDSFATGSIVPTCWGRIVTGSASQTITSTTPASGTRNIYQYNATAGDVSVVILPDFSTINAGYQLRFKVRATAAATLDIGYLTIPTDATTFVNVQTLNISNTTYGTESKIPFPTSVPATARVAVRMPVQTSAPSVYWDDVNWEMAPSCIEPNSVVASNITTSGSTIAWTAPAIAPANGYEYYYSTTNTAPTAATVASGTSVSTSVTLSTLASSTTYYIWIRSVCSTTDKSLWSSVTTFTTLCNAVNVPYTLDFESVTVPALPVCTSVINSGTGNLWKTATAPTSFTGKVLNYSYNSSSAANTWFFTQGINLTAGVSYRIKYKYANASGATQYAEKMKVAYGSSATSAGMVNQLADHPNILNAGVATSTFTDFTPTTTGVYFFGFNAYSATNMNQIYVDDINVDVTPLCTEPTAVAVSAITTNSATLTWTAPTTAPNNGYQVYYSTSNTAPTAATTPTLSVTTVTTPLSPLTPATTYYVWVRSNCGSNLSPWTSMVTFTTLATPPANDNCSGAAALTSGATFAQNALNGTTSGSTNVSALAASCLFTPANVGGNVWYSVVVPASGSLTIETGPVTGSPLLDTVISVFSDCNSTTSLYCDDDGGVDAFSKVAMTGQTPGATLLVSVWRFGSTANATDGAFQISAYDASLATSEVSHVKNNLTAYPNPFADVLNISDVKNVKSVSVIDIAGRLVKTIEKPNSALQLGELKSGMYMVVLNMNDGSKQTIKAIKK